MCESSRSAWARRKTRGPGSRGAGVQGPGVRGPGVWKTRGLVENAGSNVENTGNHYFFAKICTFLTKMRGQNIVS